MSSQGPNLHVAQAQPAMKGSDALWDVVFRVANGGGGDVSLLAAWLPHGRFRCAEISLEGMPPLGTGAETGIAFPVAFDEPPGVVVENCFVILRVGWQRDVWRVLARLTVSAGDDGAPAAKTELVTVHLVGFSG
ncbi:MAG: hypothetical protein WD533_08300 [Dehalococcoidia bacterium]